MTRAHWSIYLGGWAMAFAVWALMQLAGCGRAEGQTTVEVRPMTPVLTDYQCFVFYNGGAPFSGSCVKR